MKTFTRGHMTMHPTNLLYLVVCLGLTALTLPGCGGNDGAGERSEGVSGAPTSAAERDDHGDEHGEGEAEQVHLTAAQIDQAGIVTAEVTRTSLRGRFGAPGRVVSGLTGAARVGTLVSGRVARLYANEGASVSPGTPLAEVESFEVAELKATYLQARAHEEQTEASLKRHQQLAEEDLVPEEKLEQARADYLTAQADVSAAATKLATLGIAPASIREGSRAESARFVVRAPIGGTITKRAVQLGEYVDPGRDLFEVAAPGSGLVEVQVPQDRAAGLTVGQSAFAVLPDSGRVAGRIVSIAPVVAAESRTVPVRVELERSNLRPETFLTVYFDTGAGGETIVVPAAAIERAGREAFVYVEEPNEQGTFHRMPVALGSETAEGIEVLAGIETGNRIAVEGVFYLRSARQKGALSEHEH